MDDAWWVNAPPIEPVENAPTDWARVRQIAGGFRGRPGMVMHLGDSITRDPAYAAWALRGPNKTAEEEEACRWMRAGHANDSDGWHLATGPEPRTARNGITSGQILSGELLGATPADMLERCEPQIVIVMLGTNDASRLVHPDEYLANMRAIVAACLARHAIPVVSTIPPHYRRRKLAAHYNDLLRGLALEHGLPLIDFFSEIAARQPSDWNGTLMQKNDVHPSFEHAGVRADSPATQENLSQCGYLLRGWLSVRMVMRIRERLGEAG